MELQVRQTAAWRLQVFCYLSVERNQKTELQQTFEIYKLGSSKLSLSFSLVIFQYKRMGNFLKSS